MSEVLFTHTAIDRPLRVSIKPDSVFWSYGLNTANFPTHGGEVVQILSVYFDDLEITGTLKGYPQLEQIYAWFLLYMQLATEGNSGRGSFNSDPVILTYPERHWTFRLYPKGLPGFKYGRDVVAPTWKVIAAVDEPGAHSPSSLSSLIIDDATQRFLVGEKIDLFGKATEDIGIVNPAFSGPTDAQIKNGTIRDESTKLADFYNKLIPAYAGGNFQNLVGDFAKPSFLKGNTFDPLTPQPATQVAEKIRKKKNG